MPTYAVPGKIGDIPWGNMAVAMGISFTFWYVFGYFMGGSRIAPALIGATISGIRAAVQPAGPWGTLPDNLGVVTTASPYYATGRQGWNFMSMAVSAGVTFVAWWIAAYFLIRGSAWKYATTAALVAAVGGLFNTSGPFTGAR